MFISYIVYDLGREKMFDIRFFEDKKGYSAVKEYIDELQKQADSNKDSRIKLKKIYEYLNLLSENGTYLGEPYIKHIEEDIWELRPSNNRVFFFCWNKKTLALLHFFRKKTQKTPRREIEQAKRNRDDFLRRIR
jgi:phage-related protein